MNLCDNLSNFYTKLQNSKPDLDFIKSNFQTQDELKERKLIFNKINETIIAINQILTPWINKFYYPRQLESFEMKKNYKQIAQIKTTVFQALPDGKIISGTDTSLFIHRLNEKGELYIINELKGHLGLITDLKVLPNGKIISASIDKTIKIWSLNKENIWESIEIKCDTFIKELQPLPDGRIIALDDDNTISIWSVRSEGKWKPTKIGKHLDRLTNFQAISDGKIISWGINSSIQIWSINEYNNVWTSKNLNGHTYTVTTLQAITDCKFISGSSDCTIRIWNINEKKEWDSKALKKPTNFLTNLTVENGIVISKEHTGTIQSLQVLPNGSIISGSANNGFYNDKVIRIWRVNENGKWEDQVLYRHDKDILQLQILPDGKIIFCDYKKTIILDGELDT